MKNKDNKEEENFVNVRLLTSTESKETKTQKERKKIKRRTTNNERYKNTSRKNAKGNKVRTNIQ